MNNPFKGKRDEQDGETHLKTQLNRSARILSWGAFSRNVRHCGALTSTQNAINVLEHIIHWKNILGIIKNYDFIWLKTCAEIIRLYIYEPCDRPREQGECADLWQVPHSQPPGWWGSFVRRLSPWIRQDEWGAPGRMPRQRGQKHSALPKVSRRVHIVSLHLHHRCCLTAKILSSKHRAIKKTEQRRFIGKYITIPKVNNCSRITTLKRISYHSKLQICSMNNK